MPERPINLTGYAAEEWDRISKLLEEHDIVTQFDRTTLEQYCALYGVFAADPSGFNMAGHTQLRMLSSEMGFTPASRYKIIPIVANKSDDPFDNL